MRFLAFLLIWISLGVGAVAATTVYSWRVPEQGGVDSFRLGAEDGEPVYAVLGADAGLTEGGGPIATADTPLEPEVVEALQAGGVERVRVKSIRLSRWTHLPYFAVACVGLVGGAILTRLSTARAIRLAEAAHAQGDILSPEAAIKQLRAVARALLDDLPRLGDDEQVCRAVTHRLGEAIAELAPPILDARDRLVARMGLGGFAGFMDTFAAAERSLNRAWSAAADEALDESVESLERAVERLAVAEDKLTGRTPSLLPLG